MKILDKYILKKYFTTFIFTLLILIPITIAIDISEKYSKFSDHANLGVGEIVTDYYIPFIINYGNTFMPLALFISTILFTSKLASNTEIVAIHSAGIPYKRFLRPYLMGALLLGLISLSANHFLLNKSNKTLEAFDEAYLRREKKTKTYVQEANLQLTENDIIYFRNFNFTRNNGYDFSYQHFDGLDLKYILTGKTIRWNKKDSTYTISNYTKRWPGEKNDIIESGRKLDTTFNFFPKDLLYVDYLAIEMASPELYRHIKESENRGVKNLNKYKVELYSRTTLPVSSIILTVIAVSLASRKRRGGIGINLAVGVSLMFLYVFFMKVTEVLGAAAAYNPLFMVWIPNILFGIVAVYLYIKAKR
ncbi:LptF/LptG family permease [Aureibaculum sp. 2210JD6-5]|uniref:LptF/LptG family permease n=1 Tax=Aureibaculum sp. 2210JD6-5 TaxID=3103957 RepID=UPI002AACBCBB|nr:LptF/LptG family permease [Aureibaculum sp. 2210JD6-5]MDY7393627.1 LptF/LptG family permease [Aureibaculum sp. 2210JD6-5]